MSSAASASSGPAGPLSLAALPAPLLARCLEYTAAPEDPGLHFYRHIDTPAVYRQADYLWSELELSNLSKAFAPGWLNDPTHPFQKCSGRVRLLSERRRSSDAGKHAQATDQLFTGEAVKAVEAAPLRVRHRPTHRQSELHAQPQIRSERMQSNS